MYRFLILMCVCFLSFGSVFAKHTEPIGAWLAPRHCYANDEAYREARRQRREAEDRWIQRNRERERERNRRDRKTKKLLEKGIISEYKAVDPRYAQEELRQRRENNKKREKPCHDMDVVSTIRNRGIYLNQLGDIIIDGKLFQDITEMGKGNVICTVCHKKIKIKDIFNHYKEKKHRFFMQVNPNHHR